VFRSTDSIVRAYRDEGWPRYVVAIAVFLLMVGIIVALFLALTNDWFVAPSS
jgi:hypothetical protein